MQVVPAPVTAPEVAPEGSGRKAQGRLPLQETQASAACSQMLAPFIGRKVTCKSNLAQQALLGCPLGGSQALLVYARQKKKKKSTQKR